MTDKYMIAWRTNFCEDGPPMVKVGPWPDRTGWTDGLHATGHFPAFQEMTPGQQAQALLNLAAQMMFHGVPPADILREFAKIAVWRDMGFIEPTGFVTRAFIPGRYDEWNPHDVVIGQAVESWRAWLDEKG